MGGKDRSHLLESVEERIGHRFDCRARLERALTHASCSSFGKPNNERLEFLGDAVLGLVVSEALFKSHPEWAEGELTRVKSAVVSTRALARTTRRLGFDRALRLAPGLARDPDRLPESILAATFEALLGALYLDAGLEAARRFCLEALTEEIEAALAGTDRVNAKSWLQQLCQREIGKTPKYRLSAATGPDHERRFEVAVEIGARAWGCGVGRSKKRAEQAAAEATLRQLLGNEFERLRRGELPPLRPEVRSLLVEPYDEPASRQERDSDAADFN